MNKELKQLTMQRRLKARRLAEVPEENPEPNNSQSPAPTKKRQRLSRLPAKIAAAAVAATV